MRFLLIFGIIILAATSCRTAFKPVDVVFYTNFLNPIKTYGGLRTELLQYPIVDSLYLVGMPVFKDTIVFDVDTLSAEKLGVSVQEVHVKIADLLQRHDGQTILYQSVLTDSGKKIPVGKLARIYHEIAPCQPKFFKPSPEAFYYKGKQVVKMVIYSKRPEEVKKILDKVIQSFSDKMEGYSFRVDYEVLE